MTCPDVAQLLDAFVDTELPPSQLLDVARHAARCPACDRDIRELSALRQSVAAVIERAGRDLDLSGVWPAVAALVAPAPRRARIVTLERGVPSAPVLGGLLALAASVFFWFSPPSSWVGDQFASRIADQQVASLPHPPPAPVSARAMRAANHADIDRLAGKDIAVRREPKSGTTIIWVNHTVEEPH
jgi:anti-sigma factor RsiW